MDFLVVFLVYAFIYIIILAWLKKQSAMSKGENLQEWIEEMRQKGIGEILFTIHSDNPASIKAAEKCSAELVREEDGRVYLRI